uniref:RNA signal recognition particle 4.5S RNA n=1 Tax=Caulobacter sp. (strain K31) TaxID=366602 RepID=B0T2P9_CAUSK
MSYVDGFVIAVPKAKIEDYKAMAKLGSEVWMEYGAVSYVECLADDVPYGELTSFPRAVQATDDETVVFSWIVYRDKASRDEIMAKVMADERLKSFMTDMPFDAKRMIFGGFEAFIEV